MNWSVGVKTKSKSNGDLCALVAVSCAVWSKDLDVGGARSIEVRLYSVFNQVISIHLGITIFHSFGSI